MRQLLPHRHTHRGGVLARAGGNNAHVVLEQAPAIATTTAQMRDATWLAPHHLFALSAATDSELRSFASALREWLAVERASATRDEQVSGADTGTVWTSGHAAH